jgi:hypothetical protein
MKITEEMARMLDAILSSDTARQGITTMPAEDINESLYITLGHILEQCNYGKWLGGRTFRIFPDGISFIRSDSFLQRLKQANEEMEEKEEISKLHKELVLLQIMSAKRERILWIWGIVATIISLTLGILQFLNP